MHVWKVPLQQQRHIAQSSSVEESPAWDAVITPCGSGVTVGVICHNWGFSWQSILHLHISYYKIYISKEDSGINNNNKNVFEAREQFLAWGGGGGGGDTSVFTLREGMGGERKRVFMYLFKNSCTYLCKILLKLWGSYGTRIKALMPTRKYSWSLDGFLSQWCRQVHSDECFDKPQPEWLHPWR